jgi:hypothetical protein
MTKEAEDTEVAIELLCLHLGSEFRICHRAADHKGAEWVCRAIDRLDAKLEVERVEWV